MNKIAVAVFVGGAFGAILREALMLFVGTAQDGFPLDIFVANVAASFLLGLSFAAHERKALSDLLHANIGTGIMGGLSTFSSFVLAAVQLAEETPAHAVIAGVYVLLSIVVGFGAVLLGLRVGRGRTRAA